MAGVGLPHEAVREQVAGAIDLVVHQARGADGRRRVESVAEVTRVAGGPGTREVYLLREGRPLWRPPATRTAVTPAALAFAAGALGVAAAACLLEEWARRLARGRRGWPGGRAWPTFSRARTRGPRPGRVRAAAPAGRGRGARPRRGGVRGRSADRDRGRACAGPFAVSRVLAARRERYRPESRTERPRIAIALSDALAGGHSLRGAVGAAAAGLAGPPGRELRRVRAELELGARTEDALEAMRARVRGHALDTVVAAGCCSATREAISPGCCATARGRPRTPRGWRAMRARRRRRRASRG